MEKDYQKHIYISHCQNWINPHYGFTFLIKKKEIFNMHENEINNLLTSNKPLEKIFGVC